MDYVYYHFKTGDISETWGTAEIERYLRSTGLFPADSFTSQEPFLSISLMHVKDFENWSGNDYDPLKTNSHRTTGIGVPGRMHGYRLFLMLWNSSCIQRYRKIGELIFSRLERINLCLKFTFYQRILPS